MNTDFKCPICGCPYKNKYKKERYNFWFSVLWNMIFSCRKINNAPDTLNLDYFFHYLNSEGVISLIRDKEGKLRCLYGASMGYDCYGFPTKININNPVLGELNGIYHVNAVFVRNNKYAMPTYPIISKFACQLTEIDTNLQVNLDNIKSAVVFSAPSSEVAMKLKQIYDDLIEGKPAVFTTEELSFTGKDDISVFSQNVEYLGDKFLADRRTIINDFLSRFGINTLAMEKKERLVVGEIDSNNQELAINREYWMKPLEDAIKEANEIFGTNMSVEFVGDVKEIKESDMNVDE